VDARNHGDSPHTLEQSYQLMAEDVKFLMEDLGVEKASLIGHSMGGRTMMYLAVIYVRFVLILMFLLITCQLKTNQQNIFSQNLWNP